MHSDSQTGCRQTTSFHYGDSRYALIPDSGTDGWRGTIAKTLLRHTFRKSVLASVPVIIAKAWCFVKHIS